MIHFLVIEDEAAIRDMIRFAMPQQEFTMSAAGTAAEAMQVLMHTIPDLIVLDWMLPGKSGIELLRWIRSQELLRDIPVIMLTARVEEENTIKGLAAGCDDYMTKPFSPKELFARMQAVLRRGPIVSVNETLRVDGLVVDVRSREVSANGKPVDLRPTEFAMLVFFMKHPDVIYTRDQLMSFIWGRLAYIDERTVDGQVRRLRAKLKPHGFDGLLVTVRGVGYQLTVGTHE